MPQESWLAVKLVRHQYISSLYTGGTPDPLSTLGGAKMMYCILMFDNMIPSNLEIVEELSKLALGLSKQSSTKHQQVTLG